MRITFNIITSNVYARNDLAGHFHLREVTSWNPDLQGGYSLIGNKINFLGCTTNPTSNTVSLVYDVVDSFRFLVGAITAHDANIEAVLGTQRVVFTLVGAGVTPNVADAVLHNTPEGLFYSHSQPSDPLLIGFDCPVIRPRCYIFTDKTPLYSPWAALIRNPQVDGNNPYYCAGAFLTTCFALPLDKSASLQVQKPKRKITTVGQQAPTMNSYAALPVTTSSGSTLPNHAQQPAPASNALNANGPAHIPYEGRYYALPKGWRCVGLIDGLYMLTADGATCHTLPALLDAPDFLPDDSWKDLIDHQAKILEKLAAAYRIMHRMAHG